MARKTTIKLLLINESDNEGERLISLFRNAGRVARAHRATTAEDLHEKLKKNHWDLIIANDKHPEIKLDQTLAQLNKHHPDLPVIVLRDEQVQEALDAGACDVIGSKDDQRLVFAAFRELKHLKTQQQLDEVQKKLTEAEERCKLLMAQSQDAIAYLADGMLISANTLFCTLFGYDNPDDLDCLPLIDLIDASDHDKIKRLLKAQAANDTSAGAVDVPFTGMSHSGQTFTAIMQLSSAVLDGEPCIQLSVRDEAASASAAISHNGEREPATGLYNHDYFLNQLRNEVQQATTGNTTSTLLFISVDNFYSLRNKWGITHAHRIVLDIAHFIQEQLSPAQASALAHFCDDGFTLLLPQTSSEKALALARSFCTALEDHIIEIDKQSIQCTVSIGLVVLDKQCPQNPDILVEYAFNTCEKIREDANKEGIGNDARLYVPVREHKALGDASGDDDLDRTLEEALEDGRFILNYQPVVSLRGTSGDHYEVQAVMIDENKEVHPEQFLKTLTFTNPNTRLDRWIIIESTKQLAQQQSARNDTRLFINLTPNALLDESLIPWLSVALKAGDINPHSLIFQFFEPDIIDCLKPAKAFAEAIKELGCRLSITQFGQANDPFKTLKQIDVDFVSIAGNFTQELQGDGDSQMLKAMVSSINEHKARAIISNVENASALAVLWQLGVDYIQGNYLAGPAREMDYEFTDIA